MTTVGDILSYLETLAPRSMKMDWDNVGLLCGGRNRPVTRVLVALDPFKDVCEEAARWGAELIVTHHPLIFSPLKAVTDETSIGRAVQLLCARNISAINAHTNLDCAPGGVNDRLAETLGLSDVQVIAPSGVDELGREWGLLRQGTVEAQPLPQFLSKVKSALHCDGLRYVNGGKPVHRVAVGGGACASELQDAVNAGCDTFVTADLSYHQFLDAKGKGINLIDAGHFPTEDPVCEKLVQYVSDRFQELAVTKSTSHREVIQYYVEGE